MEIIEMNVDYGTTHSVLYGKCQGFVELKLIDVDLIEMRGLERFINMGMPVDIISKTGRKAGSITAGHIGGCKLELKDNDVKVTKVIYHNPATIVFWSDGTKTVVKCDKNDTYDPEKGFYIACTKKLFGNNYKAVGRMNKALEMAVIKGAKPCS